MVVGGIIGDSGLSNKTLLAVFIFIFILFAVLVFLGVSKSPNNSTDKSNDIMNKIFGASALAIIGGARRMVSRNANHAVRVAQRAQSAKKPSLAQRGVKSGDKLKNVKENPQSNFEVRVRDIFGQIAKNTIELARAKGKKVPDNISYKFYTMYPSWLRW